MAHIAFVDMDFHKKTQSNTFLVKLLEKYGHHVDVFWDSSQSGGSRVHIEQVRFYDAIVMFQVFCCTQRPYCYYSNNITTIPMLDSHLSDRTFARETRPDVLGEKWQKFGSTKICNFSKSLHGIHTQLGLYSKYFQFFPETSSPIKANGLHGFFWARNNAHINLEIIYELIRNTYFDSFHIHMASDPDTIKTVIPDFFTNNIGVLTTSTWFDSKSAFMEQVHKANVYFAPRPVEGIGQSFLEAMSCGQCVVAPDFGTMNEYIHDGVNGLLYNRLAPTPLDFSAVNLLCNNAYLRVQEGYVQWEKNQSDLVEYIMTPASRYYATLQHSAILAPRISIKRKIINTKLVQYSKPYIKKISRTFAFLLSTVLNMYMSVQKVIKK